MYEIEITIQGKGTFHIRHHGQDEFLADHGRDVIRELEKMVEAAEDVVSERRARERTLIGRMMRWLEA